MRLAHFARSNTSLAGGASGDNDLYGVPEVEINRSASNLFESNSSPPSGDIQQNSWPAGTTHFRGISASSLPPGTSSLSVDPSVIGGGGAGGGSTPRNGGGAGEGMGGSSRSLLSSTADGKLPLHPIKTPTHTRQHRHRMGMFCVCVCVVV